MTPLMKTWDHVKQALIKRNCPLYFMGGTLCVDVPNRSPVCMNLSGQGFIANVSLKNEKVYVPEDVMRLVKEIYIEVKGKTSYYYEHFPEEQPLLEPATEQL